MTEEKPVARRVHPLFAGLRSKLGTAARLFLQVAACWILAIVSGAVDPLGAQTHRPPPGEMEVKGMFVLNFIRYVTWSSVEGESEGGLPVCALAKSDFANAVRQAVDGKAVRDRSVLFHFDADPAPARCRVLVVDSSEYGSALAALNAVRDAPVLTIGNGPGLVDLGGMFELVVVDRKVRFNTNLEAIRRARLHVSANLLQLSRNLAMR